MLTLLVDSELRAILLLLVLIVGARNATMGASKAVPARQSSALRRKIIGINNPSGDIEVLNMSMHVLPQQIGESGFAYFQLACMSWEKSLNFELIFGRFCSQLSHQARACYEIMSGIIEQLGILRSMGIDGHEKDLQLLLRTAGYNVERAINQ